MKNARRQLIFAVSSTLLSTGIFSTVIFSAGVCLAADTMPTYEPKKLDEQTLTSVGSDSMGGLMQRWIAAYALKQPSVRVQASSRGSASAPPALIEGSADLAPMARQMKSSERTRFLSAYGFEPSEIKVAYAAVAVFVPSSSKRSEISVDELRAIFSADAAATKKHQGEVFGQINHPYLAGYFKQKVLLQSAYGAQVVETASPAALFAALEGKSDAIGFVAYTDSLKTLIAKSPGVKMLKVYEEDKTSAQIPSAESIAAGSYVLSRSLNIYTAHQRGEAMEAPLKDFLTFVLSKEGQEIVAKQGLISLSAAQVARERALLH